MQTNLKTMQRSLYLKHKFRPNNGFIEAGTAAGICVLHILNLAVFSIHSMDEPVLLKCFQRSE